MAVQIKGTFKKDDKPNNGLESIAKDLHANPHIRRIVVAVVSAHTGKIDYKDGGQVTPTVSFDNIEVMATTDDIKAAWELLGNAHEERTGNPMPPQSLFDGVSSGDALEGQDPLPGVTPDAK